MKFDKIINKLINDELNIHEMVSADVVGDSGHGGGGVAPQDDVPYAKGDARVPKLLFGKKKKRNKKDKKDKKDKTEINIQRR